LATGCCATTSEGHPPDCDLRIRNFRLDRIAKIAARQTPVELIYRSSLVIYVVSLSAFDSNPGIPLAQIERDFGSFAPIDSRTAASARINFDGVVEASNADERATKHRAYLQLYRNGVIESVDSGLITDSSGTSVIFSLDDLLIQEVMRIFQDLLSISVEPPYALLVSLVGVMGARFNLPRERVLRVPGVLSESLDRDAILAESAIRRADER